MTTRERGNADSEHSKDSMVVPLGNADSALKEIETRLVEHLDDFAGGSVESNSEAGITGHGLILRLFVGAVPVQVDIEIKDMTEELRS